MSSLRQVWEVSKYNFIQWKRNPRVVMTFVLAFVMSMMLSEKAVSFASNYGATMQIFEAFVWTFGDGNSIMISTLLLLLLFSDMPFITQATPYYLSRTSRKIWVWGQALYVVLATAIYTAFLLIVTCGISAHLSFVGNMWSETGAMLGYSGVGNKVSLPASIKAMEMSRPYQCAATVFLLLTLYALLNVTLMLIFRLGKHMSIGIFAVLGLNLYGLLLNPAVFMSMLDLPRGLEYKANVITGWLSPLNQATYYMHNFGYDYLPRLWMSILIFIVLIILNMVIIRRRIHNYEFEFLQVYE